MESTLVGSSIAEKTDNHLIGSPHFYRKSGAPGDGHSCRNDSVGSQYAETNVGDVH